MNTQNTSMYADVYPLKQSQNTEKYWEMSKNFHKTNQKQVLTQTDRE